jgi:hypothetical protein
MGSHFNKGRFLIRNANMRIHERAHGGKRPKAPLIRMQHGRQTNRIHKEVVQFTTTSNDSTIHGELKEKRIGLRWRCTSNVIELAREMWAETYYFVVVAMPFSSWKGHEACCVSLHMSQTNLPRPCHTHHQQNSANLRSNGELERQKMIGTQNLLWQ